MSALWSIKNPTCPVCHAAIDIEEVVSSSFSCPTCSTTLTVRYKNRWIYPLISLLGGWLVAYVIGLESILFGVGLLVFTCVILFFLETVTLAWRLPVELREPTSNIQTLEIDSAKRSLPRK